MGCVQLEGIFGNDKNSVIEVELRSRSVDVGARKTKQQPVCQLCHLAVALAVHACIQENQG